MLAFLLQTAQSNLSKGKAVEVDEKTDHETVVYFDILVTKHNLGYPSLYLPPMGVLIPQE